MADNKRTCSMPACERKHYAKGWCNAHYLRNLKSGTTDLRTNSEEYISSRFWPKVDKSGSCWIWTGAKNDSGYGTFSVRGKVKMAHRVSYTWACGSIPRGMLIDHTCHNQACVHPAHLRLATNKQNMEHQLGAHRGNASGVRGVVWNPVSKKWRAQVRHFGKLHSLGQFASIAEAEAVVIAKRLELFTHNDVDRARV